MVLQDYIDQLAYLRGQLATKLRLRAAKRALMVRVRTELMPEPPGNSL